MLCVVRCGETAWEQEGRLHGSTDLPLATVGRASVNADMARLRGASPSAIHHPADEAATETAQIVARATGARLKQNAAIADPDLGLFEGLLERELADRYPKRYKQWHEDPLSLIPPEGEPVADARSRLLGAVAKLLRKSRAAEVAVVLHPIAFGLLRCRLADWPPEHLWHLLEDRQRIERYAIAATVIDLLRDEAREEALEP